MLHNQIELLNRKIEGLLKVNKSVYSLIKVAA